MKMKALRRSIVLALLSHFIVVSSGLSLFNKNRPDGSIEEITEKWTKMDAKMKQLVSSALEKVVPSVKTAITELNITSECRKQSQHVLLGLQNYKPWAMRFLDSTGKMSDGFMSGILTAFGSYDECLDTEAIIEKNVTEGPEIFKGQYCTLNFRLLLPSKNDTKKLQSLFKKLFANHTTDSKKLKTYVSSLYYISYRMGVCIPSGCTVEDANKLAKFVGDSIYIKGDAKFCETREGKNTKKIEPIAIFAIFSYVVVFLLVVTGSSMELYSQYKNVFYTEILHRILLSFSVITNVKKLMNTDAKSSLSCLNGIRFLGMTWIVLTHGYFLVDFQAMAGVYKVREIIEDFAFQPIINGTFAVDSFFFLGGLVSCYVLVKNVKLGSHKFSILMYIFHRIWRILPLYIFVLMIVFLASLVDMGPLWPKFVEDHGNPCYKSWWKNLLFINNLFSYEGMCMQHSWYLSCDFQLYLIALLILIPLLKSSVAGVSLTILGIMTSVIYSMVVTYINNYPPSPLIQDDPLKLLIYLENFFNSPIVHLGAYCVGLLTGYFLAVKPKIQIPKSVQVIGWCLAASCNFWIMYGTVYWNRGREPLLIESIMYGGLARTSWSMGLAWMVICCATGHGGIINSILSWPVFVPLARLSFAIYLIHPFVQGMLMGNVSILMQCSQMVMVWTFFGHLCISIGFAFVGSMLVEAPFLALEKVILRKKEKSPIVKTVQSPNKQNGNFKHLDKGVQEETLNQERSEKTAPVENKQLTSRL